jgi:hypothetical protein
VARSIGLLERQRLLDMTHAQLAMGEQRDDTQAHVIAERGEQARHRRNLDGESGVSHDILLDGRLLLNCNFMLQLAGPVFAC